MAAIDPSATPEHTGTLNGNTPPRATLKMVYDPSGPGDDESDNSEEEEKYLQALLEGRESDGLSDEDDEDGESSEDEEANGGPSDPAKSKKARKEAAAQELFKALSKRNEDENKDDMEVDRSPMVNGDGKKGKGKAKASHFDGELNEDEVGEDAESMEEVVICTLDPEKVRQKAIAVAATFFC